MQNKNTATSGIFRYPSQDALVALKLTKKDTNELKTDHSPPDAQPFARQFQSATP
jgi:hypothetical protein